MSGSWHATTSLPLTSWARRVATMLITCCFYSKNLARESRMDGTLPTLSAQQRDPGHGLQAVESNSSGIIIGTRRTDVRGR